jgi:hypothetical protein
LHCRIITALFQGGEINAQRSELLHVNTHTGISLGESLNDGHECTIGNGFGAAALISKQYGQYGLIIRETNITVE